MKFPASVISKRLIREVLLAALLLIVGFSFLAGFFTYFLEMRSFEEKFAIIEESYLDVIEAALWVDDRESVETALKSICRIPGIEYAAIQTKDKVVCRAGNTAAGKKLHRVFPIVHRYNANQYRLGELHVKGSLFYVQHEALKAALVFILAQASIILVVCAFMLILLYRSVVRRILTITSYTSEFSSDNFETALVLEPQGDHPDELDDLAATINQMREKLRQAFARRDEVEAELRSYHRDLEQIVEQRTASLKRMNETLQQEIVQRTLIEEEREHLIRDLQNALAEVKHLSGMLPICSHCKKIRDDQGYWSQVDAYITNHSEATFSHSICPECAEKYYPDLDLYGESRSG